MHEAQLHQENAFLTLTYNDQHLPQGGTLIKKHFQDFMKRLRRWRWRRGLEVKINYFHCGEYGEKCKQCERNRLDCKCREFIPILGRPHYHAVLFGHDFGDKLLFKKTWRGDRVFTSETLSQLWGMGRCSIGAVTFESAAYVARYVCKKISGAPAASHYRYVDAGTGEVTNRLPEYITMSLKPAIGKCWFIKYGPDVYPDDFVVMRGARMKPPKFYDRIYELAEPEKFGDLQRERKKYAAAHKENSTPERLAVREIVKKAQTSTLKRELD